MAILALMGVLAMTVCGPALGEVLATAPAIGTPAPGPLAIGTLAQMWVHTFLVGLHLIGLCFGLGGTTMLDFWLLRWMRWGGMPAEIERTFQFISKVVTVGLCLLWLSGLGFLALYAFEAPEKFEDPKLWAKMTVVCVLTVNGLIIRALVLPGILRDVRRPMLHGLSRERTAVFLVSGVLSGVSWYTAFALGLVRGSNGASFGVLIGLWLAATATAALGAGLLWQRLRRTGRRAAFLEILEPDVDSSRATVQRTTAPTERLTPELQVPERQLPKRPLASRIPVSRFVTVGRSPTSAA